ncbi:hypothetical protein X801_05983, partial [Opisthorchis viverrini]
TRSSGGQATHPRSSKYSHGVIGQRGCRSVHHVELDSCFPGKSTVAVNLSLALKNRLHEEPIGLLDLDVFGPSIPRMMGLDDLKPEIDSKKRIIPLTSYGIKCMSMGFLVDSDSAVVWRGLMVMSAVQQLLRQVIWGPLHTLVIDMPPGTGDVQLSLCQNVPIQGVVIVTTPQTLATSDTRRGIQMLKTLNVPIYGIVENMTEFICPACGHHSPLFGHQKDGPESTVSGGDRLAEATGLPVLARFPIDPELIQSADAGKPLMFTAPQSKVGCLYDQLAEHIIKCQNQTVHTTLSSKNTS